MRNWITYLPTILREFALYNIIFSVIGVDLLHRYGLESVAYVFWIKFIGFLLTFGYYLMYRKKYLYFFYNLGIEKSQLLSVALISDLLLMVMVYYIMMPVY